MLKRAEIVERSLAHILERGGIRRTWLRGRENVHKRYLIHVAGHNLGDPDAPADRRRNTEGSRRPRPTVAARGSDGRAAAIIILAGLGANLGVFVVIVSTNPA
jgi:hypothetical protein